MPKAKSLTPASERLACLDAYRGFVILAMIWVNYIGEMPGIPDWLKHATASQDTFTIPDLVFPGFLFMVGLALPLSLGKRLAQGASALGCVSKVFWRALGLILAGVVMVNADRYDAGAALLPRNWYFLLFYASLALLWLQGGGLRSWLGGAGLLFVMVTFRGTVNDEFKTATLEHSWWGILGIIGWAYLASSLVYLSVKGSPIALLGAMGFMLALYMGAQKGRLDFLPSWITDFVSVGELFGSVSANVLAGAVAGSLFTPWGLGPGAVTGATEAVHVRRIRFMLLFALGMILSALLLRPYHPISKISATETFTLITAGINLGLFMLFYILMDVLKWRGWAVLLIPVGTNALLAYILPDFWNVLMGVLGLGGIWWRFGWPFMAQGGGAGLLNAAAVALFMVFLTALGTRAGLKLKL
jgi:predicted acyltransferase